MIKGFDTKKYLELQTEKILQRIEQFNNKLYLEFGGKLFDDLHAARVLPGYEADAKIQMLKKLKNKCEIIFVISAVDIQNNKMRGEYGGISYEMDLLRQIDSLREQGLFVSAIVITLYSEQPMAKIFATKLMRRNERVYFHTRTKGYPNDVSTIVSDEGYGANPYIETTKPLVVITAPGASSGKLATCLSQLYHEYKRGKKAGYAKFETFPVWDLDIKHPINVAYEAATADIKDVNMIDNFHYNAHGIITVNYNRDLEIFPVISNILTKILGTSDVYKSPTEMGVNMVSRGIINEEEIKAASKQEVIRRYFRAICDYKRGVGSLDTACRIEMLLTNLNIKTDDRLCVNPANEKSAEIGHTVVCLELPNGEFVFGKQGEKLSAASACILNALKVLMKIDHEIELIPSAAIQPVVDFKRDILSIKNGTLELKDVLLTLSMSATINPIAKTALTQIKKLANCQAHSSAMLSTADQATLAKLKIQLTSEPKYSTNNLYEI